MTKSQNSLCVLLFAFCHFAFAQPQQPPRPAMRDGVIPGAERQITTATHDHVLTNINCWSHDSRHLEHFK